MTMSDTTTTAQAVGMQDAVTRVPASSEHGTRSGVVDGTGNANARSDEADKSQAPNIAPPQTTLQNLTQSSSPHFVALTKFPDLPPKLPPVFPVPRSQALAKQTHEIVVPSHAAWFSFDSIHNVERKLLPEFFNCLHPSKTPEIYKSHRNFMVNCFRLNPGEYLTITACRRNLVGDVAGVIKIHGFLEQWGLINFQIEPDTRPSMVGPTFRGHFRITAHTPVDSFVSAPNGVIPATKPSDEIKHNLPTSISKSVAPKESIIPKQTKIIPISASALVSNAPSQSVPSNKPSRKQATSSKLRSRLLDFQSQRIQRYRRAPPVNCSSCGVLCGRSAMDLPDLKEYVKIETDASGTESSSKAPTTAKSAASKRQQQQIENRAPVRWHCLKNAGLDLCPGCFDDGRFPSIFLSCDFVKLGDTAAPEEVALRRLDGSTGGAEGDEDEEEEVVDLGDLYDAEEGRLPWTHEEMFLLLEGVENFDEDWGRIAYHIGTRSKEECVEKFLGCTIQEPYLVKGGVAGPLAYRGAAESLTGHSDGRAASSDVVTAGLKRKRKEVKPVWPISVLETLPCTPLEDPGMTLAALLASVVEPKIGKAVAEVAVRIHRAEMAHVAQIQHSHGDDVHKPTSPTRKTPAATTKSPKRPASCFEFGNDFHAAELQHKKIGLMIARLERKASSLELKRCQVEVERRAIILDAISHRKEIREIRRQRKLDNDGSGDTDAEKLLFENADLDVAVNLVAETIVGDLDDRDDDQDDDLEQAPPDESAMDEQYSSVVNDDIPSEDIAIHGVLENGNAMNLEGGDFV
ncbi:hypothetical protein BC830DRAFT_1226211 [Chytriomyces sp. MP71]|nr:hypothetical protein BC830DRAFT_1226211 [Chytriomyces sp. MP71]